MYRPPPLIAHADAPRPRPPAAFIIAAAFVAALCAAALAAPAFGQSSPRFAPTPTPTSPAGVHATVDLPTSQHTRNVGGSDGAGLCVFTSVHHAGRWQGVAALDGFREWMRRKPGGGYPQKVDAMLAAYCREKGVSVPGYVQHTGGDDTFLDLALHTDRMPCVTYDGRDDFYSGIVYHMVNLTHMDGTRAAILDNNRPGVWLWMSRTDFLSRWRGSGGGWAIVLLDAPPPPYTTAPTAATLNEWVGTGAAPPDLAAGRGCGCGGAAPCECGAGCRCRPPVVFGQCSGGSCRVQPSNPQPYTPAPQPDEPVDPPFLAGQGKAGAWVGTPAAGFGFWIDGRRVYDLDTAGRVRKCNANGFPVGDPLDSPAVELPAGAAQARPLTATGESIPPGGVVPHRVHDAPAYSLSGRPCSKDEAHAAVGGGNLADDSDRWHLTAVGGPDLAAKVRADVAALPADLRGKLLVQVYPPDAWPVTQFQLPPGVSLRAPSPGRTSAQVGAVGVAEYTAGVTPLTELLSVVGGPTPKPAPPPAPPAPAKPDTPAPTPGPLSAPVLPLWVLILGGALFLFLRR